MSKIMMLFIKALLIIGFVSSTTTAQAQDKNIDNKKAQIFIDAMLLRTQMSDLFNRPYILPLEIQYDEKGLISGVLYTSDPTHKKVDKLEIKYADVGTPYIVYGKEQYEYFKRGENQSTITYGHSVKSTIWLETDVNGKLKSLTSIETKDLQQTIAQKLDVKYDGQDRIVSIKEFRVDMLNETCLPKLRFEIAIQYLDNDGVRITRTNFKGGECDGTYVAHDIITSTISKTDEFGYIKASGDNITKIKYDNKGNEAYRSYITANSGWEQLTEYDGDKVVKEDNRSIKDGKTTERTITNFLPEGTLKQLYDDNGELYKEEQNFKTRTKVNGEWTEWKY